MNQLGITLIWCAARLTLFIALSALVYGAARRRGPAVGSTVALSSLLAAIAISLLSYSPWPSWLTLAPAGMMGRNTADLADDRTERNQPVSGADGVDDRQKRVTATLPSARDSDGSADAWQTSWAAQWGRTFWDQLGPMPIRANVANRRWPALVALVLLAGTAFGLVRLAFGLRAVRGYRARSQAVQDPALLELVDILRAQMSCTPLVEIRESREISTAATIGWRRPLLLLPVEWREWTDAERRAVFAHELAHICRHDYLAWLGAQFSVALHFYHPLVHWLSGRLRLQQELAADAWGAEVAGGRRAYLAALAQMALRQDDRPLSLPARSFLPTRGTFLRRIDMLRNANNLRRAPFSRGTAAITVGLVLASGLLVAGLRDAAYELREGEAAGPSPAFARTTPQASQAFDLTYVPVDAAVVVAARPAAALGLPGLNQLAEILNKDLALESTFGLPVEAIEQFTMVLLPHGAGATSPGMPLPFEGAIIRSVKPHDWKKYANSLVPDPVESKYAGQLYYKSAKNPGGMSYFLPDDRTIVVDLEANLFRLISRAKSPGPKHAWAESWQRLAQGHLAVAVDVGSLRSQMEPALKEAAAAAKWSAFAPLWQETTSIVLGINLEKRLAIEAVATCGTDSGAEKVAETAQAALTLSRNMIGTLRPQLAQLPGDVQPMMLKAADLGEALLKEARVERDRTVVRLHAIGAFDLASSLQPLIPAVRAARGAAQRAQAANNLRQIALAMYNYHDAHGHFPAAIGYGPDGKTPHSWRVDLLPFVERNDLYRQYDLNEPWDGPNNRKLLDKMPVIYRSPGSTDDPTYASYFVPTGPTTIFSGKEGTRVREILDGTSNTILVIETKRAVPWTKPEDIDYDPSRPVPTLGGFYAGGFHAALADGAVHFLSASIDEKLLRALFTKAGGEALQVQF